MKIIFLLFNQLLMLTHNITKSPISPHMSLRLSINHQFFNQLYKWILPSHKGLKTTIELCSIPTHELSFGKLIKI